jgi:hypothetical protein
VAIHTTNHGVVEKNICKRKKERKKKTKKTKKNKKPLSLLLASRHATKFGLR